MGGTLRYGSVALVLLRRAEHVLFAALLLVGVVRAVLTGGYPVASVVVAVLVAAWYVLGMVLAGRAPADGAGAAGPDRGLTRHALVGLGWLLVLTAGWAVLVALSADFVWLAFALFLLYMQVLPVIAGVPAVAVLTAGTIVAFALHQGGVNVAAVLGPIFGAAVAVVITVVYRNLRREVDARERLLAELTAAQDRLAAAERHAGTLAERERLAREIHDTVAQSLSSIILLLRAAGTSWQQAPPESRQQLDTATDAARSALDDTRRLVRALGPAQLVGRPLTEALQRLVDSADQPGPTCRLTVDGEPYPLPTPVEVALLRAGQQALANVRAHADAHRVELTLTFLPTAVSLDIVDDGRGFDPERSPAAATTGTGMGLAAMRARLAEVGGSLVVESAPGRGTAVGASIPTGGDGQ